jgi:hypothetical protein
MGLFLAVPSFLMTAYVEVMLDRINPQLAGGDVADYRLLVDKIKDPALPMSALIQSKLGDETKGLLAAHPTNSAPAPALQTALVRDLNGMLGASVMYESNHFASVKFSAQTETRIKRPSKPKERLWLNRALLEESYPKLITPLRGPSIWWQFLAFVIISAAEIMISITCLEFAYTQAPPKMKSLLMSLYLLSISLGNAFTSFINYFIQNPDGSVKLGGANYYYFFAALMLLAAIVSIGVAMAYKERPASVPQITE